MTERMSAGEAAIDLASAIDTAVADLDHVRGVDSARRPPALAQLNGYLHGAKRDAEVAVRDPARFDADSVLWRLREPGFLRGICQSPIEGPRSWAVLLPVLVAWAFLGAAELWYWGEIDGNPAAAERGFFAAWSQAPLYLSPVAMAVAVVLATMFIMLQYRAYGAAVRMADRIDGIVHQLEADLLEPVEVLLGSLPPVDTDETTRAAARGLAAAAQQFGAAAGTLDGAMKGLSRLAAVADQLAAIGPGLSEHVEEIRSASRDLAAASTRVHDERTQLEQAIGETFTAAHDARVAEESARGAAERTEGAVTRVEAAERSIAVDAELIDVMNAPFREAVVSVSDTAETLRDVSGTVRELVVQLKTVVDEINWIAMVADGLRDPDAAPSGDPNHG